MGTIFVVVVINPVSRDALVIKNDVPFASAEDVKDYPLQWKHHFEQMEENYKSCTNELITRVNFPPQDMLQSWYTEFI